MKTEPLVYQEIPLRLSIFSKKFWAFPKDFPKAVIAFDGLMIYFVHSIVVEGTIDQFEVFILLIIISTK